MLKIFQFQEDTAASLYEDLEVQVTQIFGFNVFSYFKNLWSNRGFHKVFSILAFAKHV